MSDVRTTSKDVNISVEKTKTIIKIAQGNSGLHYIQYKIPITEERRFFFLEIIKLGKMSFKRNALYEINVKF